MATAKQIAARKKFIAAVKSGKFRKGKKKAVKKRTRKAAKKTVSNRPKRSALSVASLKAKIRVKLEGQLKELLFRRDKAKTAKQHKSAQSRITKVRKDLKSVS